MKLLIFLDYSSYTGNILSAVKNFVNSLKSADITVIHIIDERLFLLTTGAETQVSESLEIECTELEQMCYDYLGKIRFLKKYGIPKSEIEYAMSIITYDMIIAGSHSRHGLERLVGSSAEGILRHATKPVLIIPQR